MHFSTKFVALVAASLMPLLTSAIQFTNQFNSITSGQQLTLTWNGDNTPVYLELENGNPGSGNSVANLGRDISGTSSVVTIPNVPSGTYTIKIRQSGQTSYSSQFTITGNGNGPAPGTCDNCNNNNNYNNNNGYPNDMETYVTTFVSVFGTTTSTYTTTTTGPCTTNGNYGYATTSCVPGINQVINGITYTSSCTTYGYNGAYQTTSCVPGVTQIINGITYTSSCTTYGYGYPTTTCTAGVTSVVNGVTYQPTCTNGVEVINGVTQINDGQIQAGVTTPVYNAGTATTLPLTGTYTTAGTTGVQSFFGAAPKVPLSAGAAVLAGGLIALILL